MIRTQRCHDQAVEVTRRQTGPLQRLGGRLLGQIGGAFPLGHPAALNDAGALTDPFVAGIHPLGEIMVSYHTLGDVKARRNDL